jgi:hypothetical protein
MHFSSNQPGDANLQARNYEGINFPQSFSFKGDFLRGGCDWQVNPSVNFSLDLSYAHGNYVEVLSGAKNTFLFDREVLGLAVGKQFDDYVGLKGYLDLNRRKQIYNFSGLMGSRAPQDFVAGGTFDFIF